MIRLGDLPEGTVINIGHSREIEIGDKIYITFPFFSYGRVEYSKEVVLTVVDKVAGEKIVLQDPYGKTFAPIGGTKEELLKGLSELSSFNEVVVVRPPKAAPSQPPTEPPAQPQGPAPAAREPIAQGKAIDWIPLLLFAAGILGLAFLIRYQRGRFGDREASLASIGGDSRGCPGLGRFPGPPASLRAFIGQFRAYPGRRPKRPYCTYVQ